MWDMACFKMENVLRRLVQKWPGRGCHVMEVASGNAGAMKCNGVQWSAWNARIGGVPMFWQRCEKRYYAHEQPHDQRLLGCITHGGAGMLIHNTQQPLLCARGQR